jgi:hypothetical protein
METVIINTVTLYQTLKTAFINILISLEEFYIDV